MLKPALSNHKKAFLPQANEILHEVLMTKQVSSPSVSGSILKDKTGHDRVKYVVKCNRKSKMIEILLTLMHIYIIIFKESDLYYSQVMLKYNIIPSGCKKATF